MRLLDPIGRQQHIGAANDGIKVIWVKTQEFGVVSDSQSIILDRSIAVAANQCREMVVRVGINDFCQTVDRFNVIANFASQTTTFNR